MTMGARGMVQCAKYLNTTPRALDGTNIGGSSFVSHVAHAGAAIHAGLCDVALIVYGSTAASDAMAIGTGNAGGRDPSAAFVSPYGMTLVRPMPWSLAVTCMSSERRRNNSRTSPSRHAITPV